MRKLFTFTLAIVLITLSLLITQCVKEYSNEGGAFARYALIGSPDACLETKLNGDYYAGIAADSNNSIQLTAHVSGTGNYNLSTGVADGLSFSASGNFTDTGYQTITLNCTGTPDTTGVFTFTTSNDSSCHFAVNVTEQPPSNFILTGSPNNCSNPIIKGNYQVGKNFTSSNTVTINVSVITTGNYSITTDEVNGIKFSASGSFKATGNQQVTLTANGAANNPGLVNFALKTNSSQCSFGVPVLSAEPFATYVLESGSSGTSTVCAPESLQGDYVSGKMLDNSNTVTTEVYVRDLGNYCIATNTINGISFTVYGSFTKTGEQSVVLYGNGTPLTSGSFSFTPQIIGPALIGGASCDFGVTVK